MTDEEFKNAVGKFVTGVTVVSTNHDGVFYGMTVNSFSSVSLKPHLISFCSHSSSKSCTALRKSKYFAINILADNQSNIAQHFASSIHNKFNTIPLNISQFSNCPILSGIVSCIECKKYDSFKCGDHYIFIGEVKHTTTDNSKAPLVYFAKSFIGLK